MLSCHPRCSYFAFVFLVIFAIAGGITPNHQAYAQDEAVLYEEGLAAFESGDYDRAYIIWKPLAENGYANAQYSLGKLYDGGGGSIRENAAMAALWYRQAAAQGVSAAQNNLAIMYARGRGVPSNTARAVELWQQAAQQNHPMAQFNLGLSYFNGGGVAPDAAEAILWFKKAANQGVADARFALGQIYRSGAGVPRDDTTALKWYESAADLGHQSANQAAGELRAALGVEEEKSPIGAEVEASPTPAQVAEVEEAPAISTAGGEPGNAAVAVLSTQSEPDKSNGVPEPQAEAQEDATSAAISGEQADLAEKVIPEDVVADELAPEIETAASPDLRAVQPQAKTEEGVVWEALPKTQSAEVTVEEAAPGEISESISDIAEQATQSAVIDLSNTAPTTPAAVGEVAVSEPEATEPETSEPEEQVATLPEHQDGRPVPQEPLFQLFPPLVVPEPQNFPKRRPGSVVSESQVAVAEIVAVVDISDNEVISVAKEQPQVTSDSTTSTAKQPVIAEAVVPQPSPGSSSPGSSSARESAATAVFPSGSYSIWLASTVDNAEAHAFWSKAETSYPSLFSSAEGVVRKVDVGSFGTYYRVLAGTWAQKETAQAVCARMRVSQPDAFCKVQSNN